MLPEAHGAHPKHVGLLGNMETDCVTGRMFQSVSYSCMLGGHREHVGARERLLQGLLGAASHELPHLPNH